MTKWLKIMVVLLVGVGGAVVWGPDPARPRTSASITRPGTSQRAGRKMPLLSLGGLAKKNGRPGSPGSLSSGSSRTSRASQTRTNRNSPLPTQEELQKALDILKSSPAEVTKPVARQIPPKVASQLKKWLQASRASAAIKKQDTVEGQADLVTLHDEAEKARIVAAKSMGVDPQSGIHNTTIDARHNETYALRPGDARPQTTPRIPRPASRGGL